MAGKHGGQAWAWQAASKLAAPQWLAAVGSPGTAHDDLDEDGDEIVTVEGDGVATVEEVDVDCGGGRWGWG